MLLRMSLATDRKDGEDEFGLNRKESTDAGLGRKEKDGSSDAGLGRKERNVILNMQFQLKWLSHLLNCWIGEMS